MPTNKTIASVIAAMLIMAAPVVGAGPSARPETVSKHAQQAEPELQIPQVDYRGDWVQLGTFSIACDTAAAGAKELHVVYIAKENLRHHHATGQFAEGTMLIKDVRAARTETLTTGTASYAGDLLGRFVMVKRASNGSSASSTRFGDGWAWAFFEGSETQRTVTRDYRADCLSCHEPARSSDLVYVQGYPVLRQ
jgi:Cytochrome P460